MSGFDLLWSSSPLVFSSPAPSSDQPELNANDSLEQQSASSPPSSNGNFPDDEAAEHDSDPADSPSEAEEESTGDEADLDDTPSTDGDDDGGSLLSFGGDWPSSTPDIPSSLSSAKFSTTSSQASHGGDGREEQHQAFYNPDGAWGSDAGSDQDEASSASEDDELPNTEDPDAEPTPVRTESDAACVVCAAINADPKPSSSTAHHQQSQKRALESDVEEHGFAIYDVKCATNTPTASTSKKTKTEHTQVQSIGVEVICKAATHEDLPTVLGPRCYNARLVRLTGGEKLFQVEFKSFLGMAPYWRWTHDTNLRRSVQAPTGCNGCCVEPANIKAP
ncbi:hypothetical protein V8E36_003347 [Tilletia maclaganii]